MLVTHIGGEEECALIQKYKEKWRFFMFKISHDLSALISK